MPVYDKIGICKIPILNISGISQNIMYFSPLFLFFNHPDVLPKLLVPFIDHHPVVWMANIFVCPNGIQSSNVYAKRWIEF
jgi:hypothetical protein